VFAEFEPWREQFHFPHPSEEHVNGRNYDLVAHLVHVDADGHNAVVAILFEKGAAPSPLLDDAACAGGSTISDRSNSIGSIPPRVWLKLSGHVCSRNRFPRVLSVVDWHFWAQSKLSNPRRSNVLECV
jgi:hypothetical protein